MNRSKVLSLLVLLTALVPLVGYSQNPSGVRSTAGKVQELNTSCSQVRTAVLERIMKAVAGKKAPVIKLSLEADPRKISEASCPIDRAVAARAAQAGLQSGVVDSIVCAGSGA
jgi:hypothetical protein